MLKNHTIETLRQLRLNAMAEAYARQQQDTHMNELSFDERFGLLVDHEWTARQNRLLTRLLREAHLKITAAPEEIDYQVPRGLDRSLIQHLLTGKWLTQRHNVLISGPAGAGKTFLACALATSACRQGFQVRYYRLSRLLHDMMMAKGDGSYGRLSKSIAKIDLLIVDDWGLAALSTPEARELLDILDDRTLQHSTCVVSQLPIDLWHEQFSDPTLADAVLDRLVHNAYRINLKGESMRKVMNGLSNEEITLANK
ncbi:MAG: IS21-like element helper ATPase IstB [Alicyclobacillus sp.]|nr:IS21-like element helper ATPase IstB [Alicyclobacillus sp.]